MFLKPRDRFEVESEYEILASFEVIREVTNGITLDASKVPADVDGNKKIKKGMPLGKITASGKFRPYTGTKLTAAAAMGATTITVADAGRLVNGDTITIAAEAATISSIDYATNVITLSAGLASAKSIGDIVASNDGGENPTIILKRYVNVKDGDHVVGGYEVGKFLTDRIPVTVDATLIDKMPHIVFA